MKKDHNVKGVGNQNNIRETKYLMFSCCYNMVD